MSTSLRIRPSELSDRNHLVNLSVVKRGKSTDDNLQPSIFSHALAASVRSWKLTNAKPFALPVSLSFAKKTRVTRPNLSNMSLRSFSSANSLTFVTLSVARSSLSYLPPILSPPAAAAPFRRCGGTYELPLVPSPPAGVSSSPRSAGVDPGSPSGAMVSLNGHLVVKWSPLQIRHLMLTFFNASFWLFDPSFSFSVAPDLKPDCGRNTMFSPTLVVSVWGPAGRPASAPNLAHCRRSATRGLTFSRTTVFLMRRVCLTFWPSSRITKVTMVSLPSLFLMI